MTDGTHSQNPPLRPWWFLTSFAVGITITGCIQWLSPTGFVVLGIAAFMFLAYVKDRHATGDRK